MRTFLTIIATVATFAVVSSAAQAAPRRHPRVADRPGATVVQPTRTIIHNPNGTTTIIVHPRRSYLDPGTEVSRGAGSARDYMLAPGGDPGRPYWFRGPDSTSGVLSGGYMFGLPYYLPGYNPNTPF
jgi:hypothetical protein